MELKDTVEMMTSEYYATRFIAEYLQLKIRYEKLMNMCLKWNKGELNFKPTCPREIYTEQLRYMFSYLCVLEEKAQLEGIDLDAVSEM